jgi:hypothetical protein
MTNRTKNRPLSRKNRAEATARAWLIVLAPFVTAATAVYVSARR